MSTSRSCSGSSWRSDAARLAGLGAALAALLLAGGCGLIPEEWLAEDALYVEAVPDAKRTRIRTPQGARDVDDPAISVEVMGQVSGILNGLTLEALGIVDLVISTRPATYEEDLRIWGPDYTEAYGLTYALSVARDGADRFDYQFHAAPGDVDSANQRVMWGQYRRDGDGVGTGSFVLDLDVVADLAEAPEFGGRVGVVHDVADDGTMWIGMDLRDAALPETMTVVVDGTYAFRDTGAGGELCYDARYPLFEVESWEDLHAYARWTADGRGRADGTIRGGEFGAATLQFTECWDATGTTTYFWDDAGTEDGDPTTCPDDAYHLPDCIELYPPKP